MYDGTLVDSQPAALAATIEALSRFEVQATAAEVREQFGGGSRKLVGYFLERALSSDEAERAIDEATQLKIDLQVSFTDRVVLLPQARQLLGWQPAYSGMEGFRRGPGTAGSAQEDWRLPHRTMNSRMESAWNWRASAMLTSLA